MLFLLIFMMVAVVVLAIVVYRRTPETVMIPAGRARWARRGALGLAGAYAAFWLFFGVSEIAMGDFSGVAHLFPVATVVLVMALAIKRPDAGGLFLAVFGAVTSVYFLVAVHGGWTFKVQAAAFAAAPLLVSGLLFLMSAASAQSVPTSDVEKTERPGDNSGPIA